MDEQLGEGVWVCLWLGGRLGDGGLRRGRRRVEMMCYQA